MNKEELLSALNGAYLKMLSEAKVSSKKEFAELLGVNYAGMIAAMNGRESALTPSLVSKAVKLAQGSSEPKKEEPVQNDGVFIPEKTLQMFTAMSESIKNLSELLKMSSQTYGIADSKKDLADYLDAHK